MYDSVTGTMMRDRAWATIAMALLPAAASAFPNMQEGQWEIRTHVNVPKMPMGMSLPKSLPIPQSGTRTQCVAQSDIEQPQKLVLAKTGCSIQDLQHTGDQAHWRATCGGTLPARAEGKTNFSGQALEGTASVVYSVQGFQLPVTMSYNGRRIGDCQGR
jgi:hypothetical protein